MAADPRPLDELNGRQLLLNAVAPCATPNQRVGAMPQAHLVVTHSARRLLKRQLKDGPVDARLAEHSVHPREQRVLVEAHLEGEARRRGGGRLRPVHHGADGDRGGRAERLLHRLHRDRRPVPGRRRSLGRRLAELVVARVLPRRLARDGALVVRPSLRVSALGPAVGKRLGGGGRGDPHQAGIALGIEAEVGRVGRRGRRGRAP
eukprot:scaffold3510_cov118-Isochrysis_galbana.AAC.1